MQTQLMIKVIYSLHVAFLYENDIHSCSLICSCVFDFFSTLLPNLMLFGYFLASSLCEYENDSAKHCISVFCCSFFFSHVIHFSQSFFQAFFVKGEVLCIGTVLCRTGQFRIMSQRRFIIPFVLDRYLRSNKRCWHQSMSD